MEPASVFHSCLSAKQTWHALRRERLPPAITGSEGGDNLIGSSSIIFKTRWSLSPASHLGGLSPSRNRWFPLTFPSSWWAAKSCPFPPQLVTVRLSWASPGCSLLSRDAVTQPASETRSLTRNTARAKAQRGHPVPARGSSLCPHDLARTHLPPSAWQAPPSSTDKTSSASVQPETLPRACGEAGAKGPQALSTLPALALPQRSLQAVFFPWEAFCNLCTESTPLTEPRASTVEWPPPPAGALPLPEDRTMHFRPW